jgi:hypothetical protein
MLKDIGIQLKAHAPFTAFGTATGILIMVVIVGLSARIEA